MDTSTARYVVTTPINPTYSGKVCGIRIENGRGLLDATTIDPKTGYTVETALETLRTMDGYVLTRIGDAPPELVNVAVVANAVAGMDISDPAPAGTRKKVKE